jgi:hypothetical protein
MAERNPVIWFALDEVIDARRAATSLAGRRR